MAIGNVQAACDGLREAIAEALRSVVLMPNKLWKKLGIAGADTTHLTNLMDE
jgi:hypothetical protein